MNKQKDDSTSSKNHVAIDSQKDSYFDRNLSKRSLQFYIDSVPLSNLSPPGSPSWYHLGVLEGEQKVLMEMS